MTDRLEPFPAEWFAVACEGKVHAAYPRKILAEAYASGFSKACEVIPFCVVGAPPHADAPPLTFGDVVTAAAALHEELKPHVPSGQLNNNGPARTIIERHIARALAAAPSRSTPAPPRPDPEAHHHYDAVMDINRIADDVGEVVFTPRQLDVILRDWVPKPSLAEGDVPAPQPTLEHLEACRIRMGRGNFSCCCDDLREEAAERARQQRAKDVFWPPKDEAEEHLYEIRNGVNDEYIATHVAALKELWLAAVPPGAADAREPMTATTAEDVPAIHTLENAQIRAADAREPVGAPVYDKATQTVYCPSCKAVLYNVRRATPRPFTLTDDDEVVAPAAPREEPYEMNGIAGQLAAPRGTPPPADELRALAAELREAKNYQDWQAIIRNVAERLALLAGKEPK